MVYNVTPYWRPVPILESSGSRSSSLGLSQSTQSSGSNQAASSASQQASQASNFSQTYIPEYSQTPILESIAKQAQNMAPEVYQWGMDQYNKNQGNIDAMMRNAMTYASPQRIASEMGRAEAGVQQGAEAGRQNAIQDLQSFGVDPSSGRYAALDTASRVMSGAAAAGAGNQQREATTATGGAMQQGAAGLSMQNEQIGYGAGAGANALLNTASQLKYSPLGTMSGGSSSSSGSSTSSSTGSTYNTGSSKSINTGGSSSEKTVFNPRGFAEGGDVPVEQTPGGEEPTQGGFVSQELSPSAGSKVDDVDARLNAGEFVIPKDVAAWKGQEFFYKLMAQARKMRAVASQEAGGGGMGYAEGGQEPVQEMAYGGPLMGGYATAAAMGAGAGKGGDMGGGMMTGGGGGMMTGGVEGMPSFETGGQPPMGSMPGGGFNQDLQDQGLIAAQPQRFEAPNSDLYGYDYAQANPQLGYGGGYG
jgi:hypothetical protein